MLLIVGGGLFGSLAALWARHKGIEAIVFDSGKMGSASPAAMGIFRSDFFEDKHQPLYTSGLAVLETLGKVRSVSLRRYERANDYLFLNNSESFLFARPGDILEQNADKRNVNAVGDGWITVNNPDGSTSRYEGNVYVAAGIWVSQLLPPMLVVPRWGSAYAFAKTANDQESKIVSLPQSRHAISFERDEGLMHFVDGTSAEIHTRANQQATLHCASDMGLYNPVMVWLGQKPYCQGGPVFDKLGSRLWVGTGGRQYGTVVAASFAKRLVEEEIQ